MEDLRRRVLNAVTDEEIIELGKNLISIRSLQDEETEVALFLEGFMKKNGIEVEMQEVEPGRLQAIGWIRGTGEGPSLAFNGHTDIDPPPMGYEGDPYKPSVEGGRLYGQGISNMKGGVAAHVMAAVAIARAGVKLKGDLIVENVVGELQGGVGTDHTIRRGIVPDMAIVTESSGLTIGRKAAVSVPLLISTLGERRHSGSLNLPPKPVNAIDKMCGVIHALRRMKLTYEPDPEMPNLPAVNIGAIMGGQGRDYVINRHTFSAEYCTITVDVRGVLGMTLESVKRDVEKALEEAREKDPELRYEIEIPPDTYRRPWRIRKLVMLGYSIAMDESIVRMLSRNHKSITGEEPKDRVMTGSDDAGLLANAGVKVLTYGPTAGVEKHPVRTYCETQSMITCSRVLALTALDVCTRTGAQMKA